MVAAHREQHQLTERPATVGPVAQVLGPFPTPGVGAAYTNAYWLAAAAAVTARHHAGPDTRTEPDEPRVDAQEPDSGTRPAPGPGEVARTHYHHLSRAERDLVAAVILGRLGVLPTPETETTSPEDVEARARMVHEAVTHPANTARLRRALADLYPGEPESPRPRHEQDQQQTRRESEGDPQRDPSRLVPDGHRVDLPTRRPRDPRFQTQPAPQPAPELAPQLGPRWDGTPQPDRPYIDPYGGRQPRLRW